MSKKIELGKEYRFAGYDWIAVLCDNSNGVILQSPWDHIRSMAGI